MRQSPLPVSHLNFNGQTPTDDVGRTIGPPGEAVAGRRRPTGRLRRGSAADETQAVVRVGQVHPRRP